MTETDIVSEEESPEMFGPQEPITVRIKNAISGWWKRVGAPWLAEEKEALREISRELAIIFFVEGPILLLLGFFFIASGFFWWFVYQSYKNWFTLSPEIHLSGYGFWLLGVAILALIFKLFEVLPKHDEMDRRLKKAFVLFLGVGLVWYFMYITYRGWLSRASDPEVPSGWMNSILLGSIIILWLIRWAPGNTHVCKYLRRLGLDEVERHNSLNFVYGCIFSPLALLVIGKTVHLGFLVLDVVLYHRPAWAEVVNYHWENNPGFLPSLIFFLPYIAVLLILFLYLKLRKRMKKNPSQ